MHRCPNCDRDTIGTLAKMNATPISPAVCPKCGTRSYASAWSQWLNALSWEVLFWGSIVVALVLRSWWALLLFPVGIWICGRVLGSIFALRSIDAAGIRAARRRLLIALLVVAAIVAGAALTGELMAAGPSVGKAEPALPIASGRYEFQHRFAEHPRLSSMRLTATIKGRRIVLFNKSGSAVFPAGVVAEGTLAWHAASAQWIIAEGPADRDAEEVGGCSDGPDVVDLEQRIYWTC